MTIIVLVGLSVIGGFLGSEFDSGIGFVVGILGTYIILSVALIATGKVKMK
jgi:hypothetical protein